MLIGLVHLCCYNKIPHSGWFIATEIYYSQFWRPEFQSTGQSTLRGGILWHLPHSPIPFGERVTHQLGKSERWNSMPVAQCILPNPALEDPGGLLGGWDDGYAEKDEKKREVSGSSLREMPLRAEGTACGNPWRQKETYSFRWKERNSVWLYSSHTL